MNRARAAFYSGLIAVLMTAIPHGHATTVKHFDLTQMTSSAARVFRGTVIDVNPGTVAIGGGTLPTTTYRFRVVEAFKGQFPIVKDGVAYAEVTMIGSVKAATDSGSMRHLSIFRDVPRL